MEAEFRSVQDGTVLVEVGSALDFRESDDFADRCEELLDEGIQVFIFNFEGTEVLDSAGLGAIFSLHRRMRRKGADGRIIFARPTKHVQTVLRLTRTARIVEVYETVEEAMDAV